VLQHPGVVCLDLAGLQRLSMVQQVGQTTSSRLIAAVMDRLQRKADCLAPSSAQASLRACVWRCIASIGRVKAYFTHAPPGAIPDEDYETSIADIKWYARVPLSGTAAAAAAAQSSKLLGCPIFKKQFYDDSRGNFWPINKLAPCKLAAVLIILNLVTW